MTESPRPSVPLTFHNEPRVWIGCLQCYNEGRLIGDWYPASEAARVTSTELHGQPIPRETHEELWCLDVEGFPEAKEMDPTEAQRWGDLYTEVGDAQWPAFCAWVRSGNYVEDGDKMPSASDFHERYAGEWETWDDYVQDLIESTGMQHDWPEDAVTYFDAEKWGRDVRLDYSVELNPDGGVFIFRDN